MPPFYGLIDLKVSVFDLINSCLSSRCCSLNCDECTFIVLPAPAFCVCCSVLITGIRESITEDFAIQNVGISALSNATSIYSIILFVAILITAFVIFFICAVISLISSSASTTTDAAHFLRQEDVIVVASTPAWILIVLVATVTIGIS